MKFTIRYDEPLMRRVIGDYITASYRRRMMGVAVVVVLGFALSFFVESVWFRALWLALLVFLPLMGVLAYAMRARQSLRILGMLDDGRVEFTLDDEGGNDRIRPWSLAAEVECLFRADGHPASATAAVHERTNSSPCQRI